MLRSVSHLITHSLLDTVPMMMSPSNASVPMDLSPHLRKIHVSALRAYRRLTTLHIMRSVTLMAIERMVGRVLSI